MNDLEPDLEPELMWILFVFHNKVNNQQRIHTFFPNWKWLALYFVVVSPVHTASKKLENAASFLQSYRPHNLHFTKNVAFRKRSSNRRNLKTPDLSFDVDGKHFGNGAFRKRWHPIIMWFPAWVFLKHESNMTGAFKFLRRSVDGKISDVFQSKTAVFKFRQVVWTGPKWPFKARKQLILQSMNYCG